MTYLLLPLTFQIVLQSIVLFPIALIFGKPVGFKEGILIFYWWEWFDQRWPFITCICYLFGGSPGDEHRRERWFHEVGVHVKQYEELAVISDILAIAVWLATGSEWTAFGIWLSGGPIWLLPGFLTAARYRRAWRTLGWKVWRGLYMFSWHERDAYAQTSAFIRNSGGR